MTKTRSRLQIYWQLTVFFFIAYIIAWSIAFLFGADEELIRTNHSPPVATLIVYLSKLAFTISGVILFWFNGQTKEMWTRLTH